MGTGGSTPAEEGDTGSRRPPPATDTVVAVNEVVRRRGSLPIQGRYCTLRRIEDDYNIESKVVGSGMSGPVQLATSKGGDTKCAVKSFKKKGLPPKKRAELQSEVEIYICLDHPHVARLEMVYETDEDLHLVMEYMAGGELYDRLSARKQYTEEAAARTTHQMLLAVAYLHAQDVVHRDLKLENFLYERKDTDHLKLIDFGFAKFWDRSTKMSQACGSVHYVAPEVLKHSYTNLADVWSIGVIVYMLLTGSPPFHGPDDEVLKKIRAGTPHFGSRFRRLSEPAKRFVEALLNVEPQRRISAQEALSHPWITSRTHEKETVIDIEILNSLRDYARTSSFRRAVLSMMAWSLTREDRLHMRDQFLRIDTGNTGMITVKEMKTLLMENFHVDGEEAEALFAQLDTDNDKQIAYSEFLAAGLQGRMKIHEEVLRKTFSRFDRESCGKITAEDLKGVLGESFDGADIEALICEADTTGDGVIDYDEFLAYFHRADPDDEAPMPPDLSRRSQQTDTLDAVLERLAAVDDSAPLNGGASPTSALHLRRRDHRSRTLPPGGLGR